jgi:zinc protease
MSAFMRLLPSRFALLLLTAATATAFTIAGCGSPNETKTPTTKTVASSSAGGTTTPKPLDENDKPLPLDKRITMGKLENGLTYYVYPHKKPENRASIWLAVNAGAVLEDDDQRGLAHFVEHMAFNGTKRFPKASLVDFIEKIGIRFGADLNAYTSFDETVYQLQVPTDKPELLDKGFTVLRDWAGDVTFDPAEVDKERGVVLEEWRLGRGASMRLFDKTAPVVFAGSKYPERLPIGKPEIIKGASRDTLVRFYKDWYRPDLMAVIAVGDFKSAAEVEQKIKAEFSSLQNPKNERARTMQKMSMHEKTLVAIETDPELPTTSVTLMSKMPHRPDKSANDYRRGLAERLFNQMLNGRLDEIRRQPNAPFLLASSSSSSLLRPTDVFRQYANVKEDSVQQGFSALLEEVLRVERHGFTQAELDRAKTGMLRNFQQTVKEHDKQDARGLVQEIVRNFLQEEAMAGPEAELVLVEKFLPTYTLDEINKLGKTLAAGSKVITVTGPASMTKPTTEQMLAINKTVESKDIKAYDDGDSSAPLMATKPTPVPIAKSKEITEIGVTELTLKNGARVILKPTTFKNDEVRMTAFSPGGTSLAKDADFDSARFAAAIVNQGGVGPFDAVKLRKAMSGKIVNVNANISELDENVSGSASPADLETLFQLVHLGFTAPRKDEGAFASWKAREIEGVKNRRLSPELTFFEEMNKFTTQNNPRYVMPTPEIYQKVDLEKAFAFYKDRFAEAGDFTFIFVGNLDVEKIKPLIETYLGSLPSKGRKENWKDNKLVYPDGVAAKTVSKGTEPKSSVQITFHGPEKWSRDTENDMRMLGEALTIRFREVLREDMGGVYGVRVGGSIRRRPKQEYTFNVGFGCAPENVDKLKDAVFAEAKAIQEKGLADDYIAKIKETRKRSHETNLKENTWWISQLERAYTYGDDPKLIPDIAPMTEKVSSDHIKAAAKKYINPKVYIFGVLKPETAASAAPAAKP